jgi:hypothetical protein
MPCPTVGGSAAGNATRGRVPTCFYPFFLEESVRTLVETKIVVGQRGAFQLARPLSSIRVPATVQTMLAARIDRLSAEEKKLLQTAAVIGREFSLPLLEAIISPEAGIWGAGLRGLSRPS